jgi:transmembrane sensor
MEKELLLNLINKYLANQATAQEEERLLDYYEHAPKK